MADQQPRTVVTRAGSICLTLSCGLFAVFIIDVLLGKARMALGWNVPFGLGDVGQYLTLLSVAFSMTIAALLSESQRRANNVKNNSPSDPDRSVNQP